MNVLGIENLTEIVSAHKEYIEKRNKIDREYEKKLKNNGLSPIIYSASREGIHVWSINDVKLARNISVIESVIDNENYSKRLSIFHDSFEIFSLER